MTSTIYSGSNAIKAKAVAEPKRGLHLDVTMLLPVASKMPITP
jgi:hypothetical protein